MQKKRKKQERDTFKNEVGYADMVQSKKIKPVIVLIIFYCFLASAGASMTLGHNPWVDFFAAIICFAFFSSKKAIKVTNGTATASFLLLISSMYTIHGGSIAGYIAYAMEVSLAIVLLNLKHEWRIELLEILNKWFAVLLVLSIATWFVHLLIPLPHSSRVVDVCYSANGITINNYFFFKETMVVESGVADFQRFQGMFMEPGHLGTIVAFFLIVNCFDFKKRECIVFLVTILLSLSAAAYVITALGYALFKFTESGAKRIIVSALVLLVLVLVASLYNGGDNPINNLVFGKLTREGGLMESRTSFSVLTMFSNMLGSGGTDLLFGYGANVEGEGSAGFIYFFVCNGIIGCVLLFAAYHSIYRSCRTRYGLIVFIIYLVSFLQRTYPHWDAFSFPFILGLPFFLKGKKRNLVRRLVDNNQITSVTEFTNSNVV